MTKYRQISKKELVKGILRSLPEVNPLYVEKVLAEENRGIFDVTDIARYAKMFELELYKENK